MWDKVSKVLMAKEVVGIILLTVQFFQLCCVVEIMHNLFICVRKDAPLERGAESLGAQEGYSFQNPVFTQISFLRSICLQKELELNNWQKQEKREH